LAPAPGLEHQNSDGKPRQIEETSGSNGKDERQISARIPYPAAKFAALQTLYSVAADAALRAWLRAAADGLAHEMLAN
jgi:hypothetical protein